MPDDAQRYSFAVGKLSSDEAPGLAATIKARWICEQAHQQLKEKLGLDHFEGPPVSAAAKVMLGGGLALATGVLIGSSQCQFWIDRERPKIRFVSQQNALPKTACRWRLALDMTRAGPAGEHGAWADIPPKQYRKDPICFSLYLPGARNLVERFLNNQATQARCQRIRQARS